MTNREWLATLTNEEFVSWLCDDTLFTTYTDGNSVSYNRFHYPTRKGIALMFPDSRIGLLSWLEAERKGEIK